jgi:hypothetical protein
VPTRVVCIAAIVAIGLMIASLSTLLLAQYSGPQIIAAQKLPDKSVFPADDVWNRDVSKDPVDPQSAVYIAAMDGAKPLHPDFGSFYNGAPMGIPFVVVGRDQPKVKVNFDYRDESDAGPYPIPPNAPIEGGPKAADDSDRHVLVIDRDNWMLYEIFAAKLVNGSWKAGSGAIWDLKKPSYGQRAKGWTSADAAGLAIFPGLVRYDETAAGKITHAIRFTVPKTRRAYVYPATHFASQSNDPRLPPMGLRLRLKQSYDVSRFPPRCQTILAALKTHGMILADNGSAWFIGGAPDPRWDNDELHKLTSVKGADFEVVKAEK